MENLLFNVALAAQAPSDDPAAWLVCLLGVTVVFVGLVAIVGILYLMNFLITAMENRNRNKAEEAVSVSPVQPVQNATAPIENRQEIIAAVVAAVAEESGTDISAIRVISFKKL